MIYVESSKHFCNGSRHNYSLIYASPDLTLTIITVEHSDIEKSKPVTLVNMTEYISQSVEIRDILKKATGNVSIMSFDCGAVLEEKMLPFDIFIHVIEGSAEVVIDHELKQVETSQAIIIPAHARNAIKAGVRCKLIYVVIKSGYEEVL